MMTMSSLSMACAAILLARVVSGRQRRRMPTWLLPVRCLYHSFPSSIFLLLPFFPTSHPFLPISLFGHVSSGCGIRHSVSREVDGGGGLVGPTRTSQLWGGGGVAPWALLYVV
jgi:hypothetical protein